MLHLRSAAAVVFLLLSGYVSSRSAYIRRASGYRTTGTGGRAGRAVAVSQEDAASDARLLEALFGSVEAAASAIEDSDPNVPSHMKVEKDPETGAPVQLRFVSLERSNPQRLQTPCSAHIPAAYMLIDVYAGVR